MDNQSLLNWTYNIYQENNVDELRESLVVAMEIEHLRLKAQEELTVRDLEIAQLKALLRMAIKERDEAQDDCQKACFEIALLKKQLQKQKRHESSGTSSVEDEPRRGIEQSNNGFSYSDCDESIGSSPPRRTAPPLPDPYFPVVKDKPLPEKGMLLQAVMKAGPLLQTLLLGGGPLPQWRHPPPPLNAYQIPPPPSPMPAMSFQEKITRKREHE